MRNVKGETMTRETRIKWFMWLGGILMAAVYILAKTI